MLQIPAHSKNSHKGQYGRVLIVAGSRRYHGSPILNALGAELSGADLITLCLPQEHVECAKGYLLNVFIRSFVKGDLGIKDFGLIAEEISRNHVLLIGSGLDRDKDTTRVVKMLLEACEVPIVMDGDALFPENLEIKRKAPLIVTPHVGEFRRLFGCEPSKENVQRVASELGVIVLVKSKIDIVSDGQQVFQNTTGCPEMRVGGTGDVLAGIAASFIAQGLQPYEAAKSAIYHFGLCGESLARQQSWFSAQQLIHHFPYYAKSHF